MHHGQHVYAKPINRYDAIWLGVENDWVQTHQLSPCIYSFFLLGSDRLGTLPTFSDAAMRWCGWEHVVLVVLAVMQWVMLACWVGLIVAIELFMRHETIFDSANSRTLHKLVYFMLLWREIFTLEDYYGNAVRMIGSIDVVFRLFFWRRSDTLVSSRWYHLFWMKLKVSAMIHLNIGNLEKR